MSKKEENQLHIGDLLKRAFKFHTDGNLNEAKKLYELILNEDPQNSEVLHLYGILFGQIGDLQKSYDYIKNAILINPEVPDYYKNLGLVQIKLGNIEDAWFQYEKYLSIKPDDNETNIRLATMLKNMGELDVALKYFHRSLEIEKNPDIYYEIGMIYKKKGFLNKSYDYFKKALFFENFRINPDAIFGLSLLSHQTGNNEILSNAINEVVKKQLDNDIEYSPIKYDDKNDKIHMAIGDMDLLNGNVEDALEEYNRAIELDPGAGYLFTKKSILLLKHNYKNLLSQILTKDKFKMRDDYNGIITMSELGYHGRFGDQLIQYMRLKLYAKRYNLFVQCPDWIGRYLFSGCNDPFISKVLPSISPMDPDFIKSMSENSSFFKNFDLMAGIGTSYSLTSDERKYLRNLFEPAHIWKDTLDQAYKNLHQKGQTIVTLHLRRGDFVRKGCWVPKNEMYIDWLKQIWPDLKNPVLYIASDEIKKVIDDFKEFKPYSSEDICKNIIGAEFFVDFHIIKNSHIIATSHSNFSYTASWLNTNGFYFVRPVPKKNILEEFDPLTIL